MLLHPENVHIDRILDLIAEFIEALLYDLEECNDPASAKYKEIMTNLKQAKKVETTLSGLTTNGITVTTLFDTLMPLVPLQFLHRIEEVYERLVSNKAQNSYFNNLGSMILCRQGVHYTPKNESKNKVVAGCTLGQAWAQISQTPGQTTSVTSANESAHKNQKRPKNRPPSQQQQQQQQQQRKRKNLPQNAQPKKAKVMGLFL